MWKKRQGMIYEKREARERKRERETLRCQVFITRGERVYIVRADRKREKLRIKEERRKVLSMLLGESMQTKEKKKNRKNEN